MKERANSVEDMIKKSTKQRDEHSDDIKAEETLKKAMLVLNKKLAQVQHATGENAESVSEKMTVNGHQVELGLKRAPGETGKTAHYGMYMVVDGKLYTEKEAMKKAIVMVDTGRGLTGMDKVRHNTAKAGEELQKTLHHDAPVLRRTAAIAVARGVARSAHEAERGGDTVISQLMAILGRALQAPGR